MKRLLPFCVFILLTCVSITACEKTTPPEDAQQTQKTGLTEQTKQDERAEPGLEVPAGMGIQKVEYFIYLPT